MNDINKLLSNLSSEDSGLRDDAAIELMEIGNPIAIGPLIHAILKPENVNHRGTLVYALSDFDCSGHLELLIDLVVTGNFEVSAGAFNIISEIHLSDNLKNTMRETLFKSKPLTEHNKEGYDELLKLTK